jgi:AraC-like DNA-binding protein
MQGSLLASIGRILWRLLDAHDVDAESLFKKHGLDPSVVHESRGRYPFYSVCDAWLEAASITNNLNIGLEATKFYTPLDLNALGVTFLSSSTLMEALQRLGRYESVLNSSLDFSIVETADLIQCLCEEPRIDHQAIRIIEDVRMSVVLDMCRSGHAGSLDPIEVAFTYSEPKDLGDHFGVFRCPLVFDEKLSRISFRTTDAHRPFTDANRELATVNDQILDSMIKDFSSSDLVSRVKRAIVDTLPSGTPDHNAVAKILLMSSRTLQRRLADENTNFRALLLEVRRALAEKYILDKSMPLAEISYMLGFADISSFSRAFKKWTGDPPNEFRSKSAQQTRPVRRV